MKKLQKIGLMAASFFTFIGTQYFVVSPSFGQSSEALEEASEVLGIVDIFDTARGLRNIYLTAANVNSLFSEASESEETKKVEGIFELQQSLLEMANDLRISIPEAVHEEFQKERLREFEATLFDYELMSLDRARMKPSLATLRLRQDIHQQAERIAGFGELFFAPYLASVLVSVDLMEVTGFEKQRKLAVVNSYISTLEHWLQEGKPGDLGTSFSQTVEKLSSYNYHQSLGYSSFDVGSVFTPVNGYLRQDRVVIDFVSNAERYHVVPRIKSQIEIFPPSSDEVIAHSEQYGDHPRFEFEQPEKIVENFQCADTAPSSVYSINASSDENIKHALREFTNCILTESRSLQNKIESVNRDHQALSKIRGLLLDAISALNEYKKGVSTEL